MDRFVKYIMICILTTIMGFFAAAAVWFILRLINVGIDMIWVELPGAIGLKNSLLYSLPICALGGLLIGLWQKKFGPLPDNMEQVIDRIRHDGGYPYHRLHIIAVAAILPLIFGGSVGPEAGLSGLIAGLCCLLGSILKYKGDKLASITEAGFAATLGVIFGAPLFGIIGNLEPDGKDEKYREKLVSKRARILIYCFGVLGALLSFETLDRIFGHSGGLPRFYAHHQVGIDQWKWFIPLLLIGIVYALFYKSADMLTAALRKKLGDRVITSCVIAGICLAVCGFFFPASMFSGEEELHYLIDEWSSSSAITMLCTAMAKLLLINICINFGWRGGFIFPLIYSSALLGYSFALLAGMDGTFAVAILTASLYAYVVRKPATVIAILLLCFPVTYIAPIAVSAVIASKIPTPFVSK